MRASLDTPSPSLFTPSSGKTAIILPRQRYFRANDPAHKIEDVFGVPPYVAAEKDSRPLSSVSSDDVISTKGVRVVLLQSEGQDGGIQEREWVIKDWGALEGQHVNAALGEIIGRILYGAVVSTTQGIVIPEAYAYEVPATPGNSGNVVFVTEYIPDTTAVEKDTKLLRGLPPEVKAKIALCIALTYTREFRTSSLLCRDKKEEGSPVTKEAVVVDLESIMLPATNLDLQAPFEPRFPVETKLLISLLRTIVPTEPPPSTQAGWKEQFTEGVKRGGTNWVHFLSYPDSRRNMQHAMEVEAGLPINEITSDRVIENLIRIAKYYESRDFKIS